MYPNNDSYFFNSSNSYSLNHSPFFSMHQSEGNSSPDNMFAGPNTNPPSEVYNVIHNPNNFTYEEELVDTTRVKEDDDTSQINNIIGVSQPVISSECQNIDYVISNAQDQVKQLFQSNLFEEIIRYFNLNFPNFLMQNKEILYLLMKMKFFDLLLVKNDTAAAESYYFEYFRRIGKENRRNWERKEQTFMKILKNPQMMKNKNVFGKNAEDFMLELNRALYKFLYELNNIADDDMEMAPLRKLSSSSENLEYNVIGVNNINLSKIQSNNNWNFELPQENRINGNNVNFENLPSANNINQGNPNANNNNEYCEHNQEEIKDLSQFSTKEEFSDFEEELENQHECIDQIGENAIVINQNAPSSTNTFVFHSTGSDNNSLPILITTPNLNFSINPLFLNFIENQNNNSTSTSTNPPTIKKSLEFLKEKNSTFNMYHKEFIPKTMKNEENLIKKLPLLKSFKPKYTKRENVDKKIIRKFKLYLQEKYKDKSFDLKKCYDESQFWIMFLNGVLYPPFKYTDNRSGETIEFKSFNTKFLLWLFSKKGAKDFFVQFTKEQGDAVIANISSDYSVNDSNDLNQLRYYMDNMAFIFDLNSGNLEKLKLNLSTNNNLLQAPMPQMPTDYDLGCSVEKPLFSRFRKEKYDSDDDLLKLNRSLERSRDFNEMQFDFLNDDHFNYDREDSGSDTE